MCVRLIAPLFLLVASSAAQIATGINLAQVQFSGDTALAGVDLSECAANLRSRNYEGADWLQRIAKQVRQSCLQENGYFKAKVTSAGRQLPDKDATHHFAVTFNIAAGPRYRIGEITFRENHVISARDLRSMFDIKSGDVFRISAVREGIERMRRAYQVRGCLNFALVPDTRIDHSAHVINVIIDIDEGRQSL